MLKCHDTLKDIGKSDVSSIFIVHDNTFWVFFFAV